MKHKYGGTVKATASYLNHETMSRKAAARCNTKGRQGRGLSASGPNWGYTKYSGSAPRKLW